MQKPTLHSCALRRLSVFYGLVRLASRGKGYLPWSLLWAAGVCCHDFMFFSLSSWAVLLGFGEFLFSFYRQPVAIVLAVALLAAPCSMYALGVARWLAKIRLNHVTSPANNAVANYLCKDEKRFQHLSYLQRQWAYSLHSRILGPTLIVYHICFLGLFWFLLAGRSMF